jgi:hypothetical protein
MLTGARDMLTGPVSILTSSGVKNVVGMQYRRIGVNDLQRLNAVKEELARKSFRNVNATLMADDMILHEGSQRAKVPWEEATRIIRDAADTKSMWSALEARGLLWPHPPRSESGSEEGDA